MPDTLTVADIAAIPWAPPAHVIRHHLRRGHIRNARRAGAVWLAPRADVEAWLQSYRHQGKPVRP
jgi:hypothetical protein